MKYCLTRSKIIRAALMLTAMLGMRWAVAARADAPPAPGAGADDRIEFIRRATQALAGRQPTAEEVRAFREDKGSDAFANVVDRLAPAKGQPATAPSAPVVALRPAMRPIELQTFEATTWAKDLDAPAKLVLVADNDLQRQLVLVAGPAAAALNVGSPKVAYLGVRVDAPGDTLRAQLKLPEGAGLVVSYVDESGPSKGLIHQHDVLQKLDDQLLINPEQLIALVRMRKPGETVSMTVIREAKPVTESVKLGEKEKESAASTPPQAFGDYAMLQSQEVKLGLPTLREVPIINRLFTTVEHGSPVTFDDGEVVIRLPSRGDAELVITAKEGGNVLFKGPVGTEEQWKAVPEGYRQKLRAWCEAMRPAASKE